MAVALYLRVSTEEQRERQSIATQNDFALRYCALHQLQIHQTYSDDGVSGTVPVELRPLGQRLLEDAQLHKFDQLLIFKLDRLGRDTRLILNTVAELEKHGVRVRSMTEEFDTATSTGRLMLTLLSGFAAHERELIRERSMAGSNRLAETGTWLGGVVPYGYRKQGERNASRLVLSVQPIPGFPVSEVEVIASIYHLCAVERKSCQKIADHFNQMGLPSSPVTLPPPESTVQSGPKVPIWRPSQVRNLIISQTYKGQHLFGKRSHNRQRKVIVRPVAAIVSEAMWESAQLVLRSNQSRYAQKNNKLYLLRGLIRCGLCGLAYSGIRKAAPQQAHYYHCNGRQFARKLYGLSGHKCPAQSLNGNVVEALVWADIESFLLRPEEILDRLREHLLLQDQERPLRKKELHKLTAQRQQKVAERDRILALFRRGRIDEQVLDQQLDLIQNETATLQEQIDSARRALAIPDRAAQLEAAAKLLQDLRLELDEQPISPELQRRLIETLVESMEARTVERWGVPHSEIVIRYRFSQPHEPAALLWSCAHRLDSRNAGPEQVHTLGDHLRRRRLTLKLPQQQAAKQLGVGRASLRHWEQDRQKPGAASVPAIMKFLGYIPQILQEPSRSIREIEPFTLP
jgi:site-specific DNA recombinase